MTFRIQIRRGSASDWTAINPVLLSGEQGLETDTDKIKIGDGSTEWNNLPYIDDKFSPSTISINTQTASVYTLVESDSGKLIEINNSASAFVFVPLENSVNFPLGTKIDIVQNGTGPTSINPISGVTLNSKEGNRLLTTQWSAASLIKRGSNEWTLIGDLSG